MCCIFTCCGWMIDLIQRVWTFTMSCVISSAICCLFLTTSMAGIALGYNYSLAEYIDLKETNVSVYMKRGVFDDQVVDDMQWRRSGHQPVAGHIGEDNLMTAAPEDGEMPLRSGRRLDNSIYESDDRNRFEGSLMKLTAKPPYESTTAGGPTPDRELDKIYSEYTKDSLDQLKAVQSLINMRKSAVARENNNFAMHKSTVMDARYMPAFSNYPPGVGADGRRWMPPEDNPVSPPPRNPLRTAVPRFPLKGFAWVDPNIPLSTREVYDAYAAIDYREKRTYPLPVTVRRGPIRPTRPPTIAWPTHTARKAYVTAHETPLPKEKDVIVDEGMDAFKEKLLLDQFDTPNIKVDNSPKTKDSKKSEDVYDYEARGLPVRRKRNVPISEVQSSNSTNIIKLRSNHSETGHIASIILSKNNSKANQNSFKDNALKDISGNYIMDRLVTFYEKLGSIVSNNIVNKTNIDVKGHERFDAFKSMPVDVTRKPLTKFSRSRFLS